MRSPALPMRIWIMPRSLCSVEGIPYFVEHERDALLVEPGNATALARAIRRLQVDRGLGERLAAAALVKVRRNTLEQMCRRMQAAIAARFEITPADAPRLQSLS